MDKQFWVEALKQFGIGTVFAAMLMYTYIQDNGKWESVRKDDQARWETLFSKYTDDQRKSLETIQACCNARNR